MSIFISFKGLNQKVFGMITLEFDRAIFVSNSKMYI